MDDTFAWFLSLHPTTPARWLQFTPTMPTELLEHPPACDSWQRYFTHPIQAQN
jgi:hypothetical protein